MCGLRPWKQLNRTKMFTYHEDLRTRRGLPRLCLGLGLRPLEGLLQAELSLRPALKSAGSFPYTTLKGEQKNNQFCSSCNSGEIVECGDIQVSSARLYLGGSGSIFCIAASQDLGASDSQGHCQGSMLSQYPLSFPGYLFEVAKPTPLLDIL